MNCTNCGQAMLAEERFCSNCGQRNNYFGTAHISKSAPTVQSAAPVSTPVPPSKSSVIPSSSGNLVDVASHTSVKSFFVGLVWLAFACAPGALFVNVLTGGVRTHGPNDFITQVVPIGASSGLITWLLFSTAISRFRVAIDSRIHLRAGPGGLSFAIPGRRTVSSLFLSYQLREQTIRWDQVKTWHPYVSTVNGIVTESCIVIVLMEGKKIKIPTMYFSSSRRTIADNISVAIAAKNLR